MKTLPEDPRLARLLQLAVELMQPAPAPEPSPYYSQHDSPLGSALHRSLANTGRLPAYRVKRLVLIKRDEVHAYIESHRIQPRPPKDADRPEEPTTKRPDPLKAVENL